MVRVFSARHAAMSSNLWSDDLGGIMGHQHGIGLNHGAATALPCDQGSMPDTLTNSQWTAQGVRGNGAVRSPDFSPTWPQRSQGQGLHPKTENTAHAASDMLRHVVLVRWQVAAAYTLQESCGACATDTDTAGVHTSNM